MYGTVNALCTALTEQYAPDKPLTLIVWTKEEVMACLDDYDITEETADKMVAHIGILDGVHEAGVGRETLECLLENLRLEEARLREITVPAAALEKVMALAGGVKRLGGNQGGEGGGESLYPEGRGAVRPHPRPPGRAAPRFAPSRGLTSPRRPRWQPCLVQTARPPPGTDPSPR